ncbi:MAG TPA: hypothetical protein VFP91_06005 [Vicinamibacterales bacterium]|nr:hypothetical protein [Vicinamibacterales bacterium]
MTCRFKRVIAAMFLLQIVLPLAAPLRLLDWRDLFATQVHRSIPPSPESITTPAMSEVTSESSGRHLAVPIASSGPGASSAPALVSAHASSASAEHLSSFSRAHRTVLRL